VVPFVFWSIWHFLLLCAHEEVVKALLRLCCAHPSETKDTRRRFLSSSKHFHIKHHKMGKKNEGLAFSMKGC
jgi:hypothetical protein